MLRIIDAEFRRLAEQRVELYQSVPTILGEIARTQEIMENNMRHLVNLKTSSNSIYQNLQIIDARLSELNKCVESCSTPNCVEEIKATTSKDKQDSEAPRGVKKRVRKPRAKKETAVHANSVDLAACKQEPLTDPVESPKSPPLHEQGLSRLTPEQVQQDVSTYISEIIIKTDD